MSDSPVQAPAAPAPAPAATPAPEAAAPKPSRFRTDASLAEPFPEKPKIAPIKETPPKDPATGKFVPRSGDPNAGVIPEMQAEAPPAPAEEPTPEQPEPAAPEEPAEPKPTFTPVEIDLGDGRVSVFKTKEALEQHFRRMAAAQSATEKRAAELARAAEESRKAAEPPSPAQPELKNPFETSLIDDEGLIKQMYADIDDPEKGPVVAVARVVDKMEKRITELVKFIQHQQEQAAQPMVQFLNAMQSINTTAEFFKQAAEAQDPQGNQLYPDLNSRKAVTDLTRIMHKHNLALTPENFDLAYQVWKGASRPGEPQPPQEQPQQDHSAAASAAAVMSSRGTRVPDPRAERRSPSFREEMDAVQMSRGRFRTV